MNAQSSRSDFDVCEFEQRVDRDLRRRWDEMERRQLAARRRRRLLRAALLLLLLAGAFWLGMRW